ncbi:hypothetical protein ACFU5O_00880 [Streptomyces sp. NPDC057445]|uniref:hypothetical protein n=1 Tax=Streptomyces sp. NPDC057445 TaxID=3346136 RepID=UPI0036C44F12
MTSDRRAMHGQLLLLLALLFGFVTMHAAGHPAEHAPAASAPVGPAHEQHTDPDTPAAGTDPAPACLTVLGFLGVALLATRLLVRRGSGGKRSARARPLPAHPIWPNPPPLRTVLVTLSVLRH